VGAKLVRVGHAYGNRRQRIAAALAAGVDVIETDLRYDHGAIWVRHERRLWPLPLLYDRGLRGLHRGGPWVIGFGEFTLRLEPRPLRFVDVLRAVSGKGGLMIDLKRAPYGDVDARSFIDEIVRTLGAERFAGTLDFCGSWRLLDLVRQRLPEQTAHYSVDNPEHWDDLMPRLGGPLPIRAITIHPDLLSIERSGLLRAEGVEYYLWDIENAAAAERAIEMGASGVMADDLRLLQSLAGRRVIMEPR
jgi:glycerophosphoryl diester phosphodiesterase